MKNIISFLFVAVLICSACSLPQSPLITGTQISGSAGNAEDWEPGSWTLAVYMAADNDLDAAAESDLLEMRIAPMPDNLTVLILADQSASGDSRLYCLQKGVMKRISCPPLTISETGPAELNMGAADVLQRFLDFTAEAYPAQYTGLLVWGHGTGFRYTGENGRNRSVAIDDASESWISIPRLASVLAGRQLSVLGFDTCFGTTIEQLYELQHCASFIVGSPGLTSVHGWNYTTLLRLWPDVTAGNTAASDAANAMIKAAEGQRAVAVATADIPDLIVSFEQFASSLAESITDEKRRNSVLDTITSQVLQYSAGQYPCDMYVDVYSLARTFGSTDLMRSVENCCIATDNGWPGISVFLMAVAGMNVSVIQQPSAYIKGNSVPEQCAFVQQTTGWCPSWNHEEHSLLDRLFYSAW